MLSANFITFFLVCIESMDPISLMFLFAEMFTFLKGFEMVSVPDMPLQSYLLLDNLTFLGVTESPFVLESY